MKNLKMIMLPTEKAIEGGIVKMSNGHLIIANRRNLGNKIFDVGVDASVYAGSYYPQHLYIVDTQSTIEIGDWVKFYVKHP